MLFLCLSSHIIIKIQGGIMLLSERLTLLRKSAKTTLKDVAIRCDISLQYLQKLEKGHAKRPKLELLYRLASYYQFPSDKLIIEAGKIPQDVYWKIVNRPDLLKVIREYL